MKLRKAINHKIVIEPSANEGFIVKVGCGTFVFADQHSLMRGMEEYLAQPDKWEVEYNKMAGDQAELPGENRPMTMARAETRSEGQPIGR